MAGYLPGSGSLSMSSINSVFDGRGNNLNAYRGTAWYTSAGGSGTFSSGAISFNDFYNKGPSPAVTISLASLNGAYLTGSPSYDGEPYSIDLYFNTNGTWNFYGFAGGDESGNWATPTTTGIGSSYWIRFTRTFFSGGFGNSATNTTGWQQLSTARIITVTTGGIVGSQGDYTVQIATDSGGSNIVATASLGMFASTIPA
jgi:hypothetical protein